MPYQIRIRRDTTSNWTSNDPILALGEMGFATDTNEIRVGNGPDVWSDLEPIKSDADAIKIAGYNLEAGPPLDGEVIQFDTDTNTWVYATVSGGPGGGVTSVGLTMPTDIFDVSTATITTSGTFTVTLDNQVANRVFAGPTNGAAAPPTFRALVSADIPNLAGTYQVTDTSLQSIITATDPLTGAGAGNMLYLTGTKTFTGTPLTTFGRSLVDDTDAPTARTTLGLGTIATQAASNVAITGGSLSGVLVATGTYNSPVNEAQLIKARKSNATNSPITKGEVVYIVGSTGSHMTVERARADVEATSAYTIGIAATDISDTADGYIMQNGRLTGLSTLTTATYADGDTLYLSESTAGGYRKTLPTAPNHGVFLGFVIKANAGNTGEMDVRINNYQEVSELSDVLITSINDGHMLVWDNTDLRWENKTPNQVLTNIGAAAAADLADYSPITHGHGNITSSGAIGSTSGMLVKTTTSGVLTTQTKGTGSQYLKMNSGGTDVEFGTIAIGELPTGTTSTTVALGNHTHGLTTNGDILYHDGTGLARLAKGSSGQVLTATASTINWETPSATGSVPDFILYRLGIT